MNDIKLVIKIPQKEYNDTLQGVFSIDVFREAVKNGIPLGEALENQKTGHWEETTLANGRKGMKCSNCGCEPIEIFLYGYVYSDYCPYCGAKMEGGNNE